MLEHPEPHHLCWQQAVRNNSQRIIFDCLAGENGSNKNGPGDIVCHYSWHIRGAGGIGLDDKFWVQRRHKGCFPSSKRLMLHAWKLKAANDLNGRMRYCTTCEVCVPGSRVLTVLCQFATQIRFISNTFLGIFFTKKHTFVKRWMVFLRAWAEEMNNSEHVWLAASMHKASICLLSSRL